MGDIEALTFRRKDFNIMDTMLIDAPRKGCKDYQMETTHGPGWVAWQEAWLDGLKVLRDRQVIVVAKSDSFKNKFLRPTTDTENRTNYFDASYELPDGERANCILDWERRHVAMCAVQNNLQIRFIYTHGDEGSKPDWYPLPEEVSLFSF